MDPNRSKLAAMRSTPWGVDRARAVAVAIFDEDAVALAYALGEEDETIAAGAKDSLAPVIEAALKEMGYFADEGSE